MRAWAKPASINHPAAASIHLTCVDACNGARMSGIVAEFHLRVGSDDFHGDDAELARRLARLRDAFIRACAMCICLRVHENSSPDRQARQLWLTQWLDINTSRQSDVSQTTTVIFARHFQNSPTFPSPFKSWNVTDLCDINCLPETCCRSTAGSCVQHHSKRFRSWSTRTPHCQHHIKHTHLHTCKECDSGTFK